MCHLNLCQWLYLKSANSLIFIQRVDVIDILLSFVCENYFLLRIKQIRKDVKSFFYSQVKRIQYWYTLLHHPLLTFTQNIPSQGHLIFFFGCINKHVVYLKQFTNHVSFKEVNRFTLFVYSSSINSNWLTILLKTLFYASSLRQNTKYGDK